MKTYLSLMLMLLGITGSAWANDHELWLTANLPTVSKGKFSTKTHTHWRFPEEGFLRYYRFSQKFYYQLDDTWSLGLHPVVDESRKTEDGPWSQTRRLDLEANPKFKFENLTVSMRNRFEFRWREGRGSELFNRLRHRTGLSWKASWFPGMTSFGMDNEIFYDFDTERISGNWFVPAMIKFKPSEYISCSFAYRLTSSNRGSGVWVHTNVWEFGGSLNF